MIETTSLRIDVSVDLEYDSVCEHWAWRVGNEPWSKCFDSKLSAIEAAQEELRWRVNQ